MSVAVTSNVSSYNSEKQPRWSHFNFAQSQHQYVNLCDVGAWRIAETGTTKTRCTLRTQTLLTTLLLTSS